MPLDEADIRQLAALARLHLDDDEIAGLTHQLDAIVGYVDSLTAVDTEGVEPVAHVTGLCNVTRADEPGAMMDPATALQNAPKATEAAFLVPKAVDR